MPTRSNTFPNRARRYAGAIERLQRELQLPRMTDKHGKKLSNRAMAANFDRINAELRALHSKRAQFLPMFDRETVRDFASKLVQYQPA